MNPEIPVAQAFFDVLRAHGVRRIFGNPGSNELPMLKHLPEDIEYVLALNEAAAVAMADGYASATGSVGVVSLHSSSGTGNAMGMLTNAAAGHSPLVVIAGQQTRRHVSLGAMLANADATRLPEPLVKWAAEPLRPADVPLLLSQAILSAAASPRGPVYLSIPLDDWDEPVAASFIAQLKDRTVDGDPVISDAALHRLTRAMDAAKAPALVLGPGVDTALGWSAAIRVAETHDLAVWAAPSPSRAPFPTRHPCFRGALPTGIGAFSKALAGHDVVFTFGTSVFRYHEAVDGDYLAASTVLFGVTSDPDEAARAPVGSLAVGDPSDALDRLSHSEFGVSFHGAPPARTLEVPSDGLSAAAILDAVDAGKSPDTVVVLEWTSADRLWHRLNFTRPQSYYFPASGGLGWGMGAAVGIAMASRARPVVALIGDGAMQYSPSALWTAAEHSVPVTFVIAQNTEYGALRRFARQMGVDDAPYLELPHIDPVAIAHGYGITARRLASVDELITFVRDDDRSAPRLAVIPQV